MFDEKQADFNKIFSSKHAEKKYTKVCVSKLLQLCTRISDSQISYIFLGSGLYALFIFISCFNFVAGKLQIGCAEIVNILCRHIFVKLEVLIFSRVPLEKPAYAQVS